MIWKEDYKNTTDWDRIGEGDNPAQNPPIISEGDRFALEWFYRNVSGFSMEAGILPMLIERLGLTENQSELFMQRVGLIYNAELEIVQREIKKKGI